MSKYSQLPRDTLTLLEHRAKPGLLNQEYLDWAGNALVDGFDSSSLAILAGLSYVGASPVEISEYFIRAIKELDLPIPDCELAYGHWYWTDIIYRELGLSLPDEEFLLGQHLFELAEQIKEGVIDPVIGLDRIYREVVLKYKYCDEKYRYDLDIREVKDKANFLGWEGDGAWEWDEFIHYINIVYDDYLNKDYDKNSKNRDIVAFATKWLKSPKTKQVPRAPVFKNQANQVPKQENRVFEVIPKPITEEKQNNFQIQPQKNNQGLERCKPNIVVGDDYLYRKKHIFIDAVLALFTSFLTLLFLSGIGYIAINFFTRGEKVSIWTLLGGLIVTFMLGAASWGNIKGIWIDVSRLKERRKWIKNAVQIEAEVVDRKAEYNDYAESREETWDCEINVKYLTNLDSHLVGSVVKAKVSDKIFFRYENQSSILIYLAKSNPYCFLIEGE